jgi:predicted PP-loop superfamily ATPase
MDRPVAFDRRHDVLISLSGGHDHSTENLVPLIWIMFHVSSIAIATSDRIGRNQL